MIITETQTIDLKKHSYLRPIIAVQNDRYTRNLELTLMSGGEPWIIPENISVLICYSKADGQGGTYDVLPDGTSAWSAAGNVLTIALAPQVLTVPGAVTLTVTLVQEQKQLSLSSIILEVLSVAHAHTENSEDYFHVIGFLPAPDTAQPGQYIRVCAVNDLGHVTKVEAVDPETSSNETVQGNVAVHNAAEDAHPDIRQQMGEKLSVSAQALSDDQKSQVRENIGVEELLTKTTKTVTGINLNDGVYEIGRFSSAGEEYDLEGNYAFRSANYLPVEGGRSLVAYYAAADWNLNTLGYLIDVVQYDAGKNIIGATRSSVKNYANSTVSDAILVLNENTAYIRIDYNRGGTTTFEDLTAPKIAIYYLEDAVQEFVEYTIETAQSRLWINKSRIWNLDPLYGKKIVYDGDSIAEGRNDNGGGYAKMIAEITGGAYVNQAQSAAHLCSGVADRHCLADNLTNLPTNGDLYCFQGGINDYWGNAVLGTYSENDFTGTVDTTTVCGALETIFRYALNNFSGKPIVFVITHKVQNTAYTANTAGNTFKDYRDSMVGICRKYSIPYYDAFTQSGLNGWNEIQGNLYLTGNSSGTCDGCHPNAAGYARYYVPQLLDLFRKNIPSE